MNYFCLSNYHKGNADRVFGRDLFTTRCSSAPPQEPWFFRLGISIGEPERRANGGWNSLNNAHVVISTIWMYESCGRCWLRGSGGVGGWFKLGAGVKEMDLSRNPGMTHNIFFWKHLTGSWIAAHRLFIELINIAAGVRAISASFQRAYQTNAGKNSLQIINLPA